MTPETAEAKGQRDGTPTTPNASAQEVLAKTLDFVAQYVSQLTPDFAEAALTPTQSLLTAGVLDSMFLLDVVAFLEDTFHITIAPNEVRPDTFETLDRIAGFVVRKQAR